ncbi:hypothetical protein P7K49_034718 [Saguinus oedipus]|uniref:EF-hand domain-containing protein n=1 Tax=Saguinus oedipus TaxID=9490 RepID=A0ABQ9TVJ0_SAGOE|nr:hypothetical protein P7K49_034718 [Saguinus oedipus]
MSQPVFRKHLNSANTMLAFSQYLQLKKKLEDEFPGRLDIKGDGYVDTESKFLKLVAAIKAALAQG